MLSFKLIARTDAAGKYRQDAPRDGNEDNYYVKLDLSSREETSPQQNEIITLGSRGLLMAVADGMGGMNAGEVASQIAIETLQAFFSSEDFYNSDFSNEKRRVSYLEQAILACDKAVKLHAKNYPETEGMGSTVILAWLYENKLSISWCGDSRAYLYNKDGGLRLISKDHSYVQELVDAGKLTYNQTFDHPQNNIVTRSLGDPYRQAKAESKTLDICRGDIILLCSDGLSGVLRDRKTYDSDNTLISGYNIEDILIENEDSLPKCIDQLWEAAEASDWYDNVTVVMCQVVDSSYGRSEETSTFGRVSTSASSNLLNTNRIKYLLVFVIFILCVFFVYRIVKSPSKKYNDDPSIVEQHDEMSDDSSSVLSDTIKVEQKKNESSNDTKSNSAGQKKTKASKPDKKESVAVPEETRLDTASSVLDEISSKIKTSSENKDSSKLQLKDLRLEKKEDKGKTNTLEKKEKKLEKKDSILQKKELV